MQADPAMKSSAMNKPDERLVYLALRGVFSGEDAKIRSAKAIRKQIQKHQQREDVKSLLNNHNQDHVFNTARELLESHIFESTIDAKIRFPEVFSISPAQSADREQSEEEAARSEANAIKNAAEGRLDDLGPNEIPCETSNQDPTSLATGMVPSSTYCLLPADILQYNSRSTSTVSSTRYSLCPRSTPSTYPSKLNIAFYSRCRTY